MGCLLRSRAGRLRTVDKQQRSGQKHQRRDTKACKVPLNVRTKRSVINCRGAMLLTERDGRARLAFEFRMSPLGQKAKSAEMSIVSV
jgi:hypothetical protein